MSNTEKIVGLDDIYGELVPKATFEWMKTLGTENPEKLTTILQRIFDEAHESGKLPAKIIVTRYEAPCGRVFVEFGPENGKETLSFEPGIKCSEAEAGKCTHVCAQGCLLEAMKENI